MEFFERRPVFGSLLVLSIGFAISAILVLVLISLGILQGPPFEASAESQALETGSEKDLRILVLGDSFVSHWNLDHHLKGDLEAYAAERDIGLVNVGKYGAGPLNYYFKMKELFSELNPGLVLLFYYVGNDLTDIQYFRGSLPATDPKSDASLIIPKQCKPPLQKPSDGPRKFDWDEMIEHGIDPELVKMARRASDDPDSGHERINPWMLRLAMRSPHYLRDNILVESKCNQVAWLHTARLLSAMFEMAREGGAEFQVVAIPETTQIDRSHFDLYQRATFDVDDAFLDSNRPQELLGRLSRRHGVPMTDLLPRFKSHPDSASLYWPYDPHFSEAGHRYAFQIVREEILDPWFSRQRK